MIKFLDLQAQYRGIKPQIDKAISEVLESGAFVGGKFLEDFQQEFARELGVDYVLGVANGTEAIEFALKGLNLKEGSEVILPANTFLNYFSTKNEHVIVSATTCSFNFILNSRVEEQEC